MLPIADKRWRWGLENHNIADEYSSGIADTGRGLEMADLMYEEQPLALLWVGWVSGRRRVVLWR